jgi:hypothetical protein
MKPSLSKLKKESLAPIWRKEFDDLMDDMSMYADDTGISQVLVDKLWSWFENKLSSELDRARKEERNKIRRWTKGRYVDKEKLRHFLNILDTLKQK